MNRCPISYAECEGRYSPAGLARLGRGLTDLADLPWTAAEQLREAAARADKLSIQGVQPKLSARFSVKARGFVLVDRGGTFILKPPNPLYREIPENEDLTLRLAQLAGIEVPFHGLVYAKDGSRTYFIRRFDRAGRGGKVRCEDFAQLLGRDRETKYDASMEQVARGIERFCTFPAIEHQVLLRRTLFCFLTGNEDMHLKNFSVVEHDGKVVLSPAYDLVNSTIALERPAEELALPLMGRKRKLTRADFFDGFGTNVLGLNTRVLGRIEQELIAARGRFDDLVRRSFLSVPMQERYLALLARRCEILFGS